MGFPLLQHLSLAGDFAIVVLSGAAYARRKFTGEIFYVFLSCQGICKHSVKAKHLTFLLSSQQHAEGQLCTMVFPKKTWRFQGGEL